MAEKDWKFGNGIGIKMSNVKLIQEIQTALSNLKKSGLLLQLERKGPVTELAKKIVKEHLPLLEKKQWDQIAKLTEAPIEKIREAAHLIAHLDPKPGTTFYGEDSIAVTPDAAIYYDDAEEGKLNVEVTDEDIPELRVSSYYRKLAKDSKLDEASRKFLKDKIQAAIEFVKALGQRRSTLYQITEELVKAQWEFFDKGFSHLKPLRLKDISARLGIHESTVSRALQGKYVSTPRGTLPYKSFFSTKLETAQGDGESQKSIMEKIREMIREENPQNPLSDQAMATQLQNEGIRIARRTVAKYREMMKILPAHLRRNK
jgi:RNA polymerase sigma-54 factor